MLNKFRLKKTRKSLVKMTYFEQIRFMKILDSEELQDFKDVIIINKNPKFLENGN